jgi:hypothetical protein
MKTARSRNCLPLLAVTGMLIYSATAAAQGPNLALNKPVIDESTQWFSGDQTVHQYDGAHITDGLICEDMQNEGGSFISSFWLGAEGAVRAGNGYAGTPQTVTVDLQAPTMITEIHLRNTHNAQFNDRATMDFQINAANDVCTASQGLTDRTLLINPVTILNGTLSLVDSINCPDPIPPDIFTSTDLMTGGKPFRYVQFIAINAYPGKNNNVGLNELEVYGSQ